MTAMSIPSTSTSVGENQGSRSIVFMSGKADGSFRSEVGRTVMSSLCFVCFRDKVGLSAGRGVQRGEGGERREVGHGPDAGE